MNRLYPGNLGIQTFILLNPVKKIFPFKMSSRERIITNAIFIREEFFDRIHCMDYKAKRNFRSHFLKSIFGKYFCSKELKSPPLIYQFKVINTLNHSSENINLYRS